MHKQSKQIRCRVVRRSDLITNAVECRIPDVQAKLAELLSAGYNIYDMASAASGFASLGAMPSGNYVVVWKGGADTDYSVAVANITAHTNVVVILANVNSTNQVLGLITTQLTLASGNYAGKLTVYGGTLRTPAMATPQNLQLENLRWEVLGNTTVENILKTSVRVVLGGNLLELMSAYKPATTVHISGAYEYEIRISTGNNGLWLSNVLLDGLARLTVKGLTSIRVFNHENVMIWGFSDVRLELVQTNAQSTFFYNAETIDVSTTGQLWNQIGSAGLSAVGAEHIAICRDSNNSTIYVAYRDASASNKLTVRRFVNGAWQTLGSAGFSAGAVKYVAITADAQALTVVYADESASTRLRLAIWNGSSWTVRYSATEGVVNGPVSIRMGTRQSGWNLYPVYCITHNDEGIYTRYTEWDNANSESYTVIRSVPYSTVGNSVMVIATADVSWYDRGRLLAVWSGVIYLMVSPNWGSSLDYYTVGITGRTNTGVRHIWSSGGYVLYQDVDYALVLCSWSESTRTLTPLAAMDYISCDYHHVALHGAMVAVRVAGGKASVYQLSGGQLVAVGLPEMTPGAAEYLALTTEYGVPALVYRDAATSNKASAQKYDDPTALIAMNYMFRQTSESILHAKKTLSLALIEAADDYFTLGCIITPQNAYVASIIGRTLRNNYRLTFADSRMVDDRVKQLGADDYLVRSYEYEDTELIGKRLKNLILYNADMTAASYSNNDNVMVIARNQSNQPIVAIWYSKRWHRTLFGDIIPNEVYTITHVFQLLEVVDNSDFVNMFASIPNSPLEAGSITLNNYDNEVISL